MTRAVNISKARDRRSVRCGMMVAIGCALSLAVGPALAHPGHGYGGMGRGGMGGWHGFEGHAHGFGMAGRYGPRAGWGGYGWGRPGWGYGVGYGIGPARYVGVRPRAIYAPVGGYAVTWGPRIRGWHGWDWRVAYGVSSVKGYDD